MINSVELTNFKNLRHQRIDLERLTVFVGANGSGKTSVLEAIHYAVSTASPEPSLWGKITAHVFRGDRHCDWLYSRGGSGDMSITCVTPGGTFTVSATPPPGFPPQETGQYGQGKWEVRISPEDEATLKQALEPARSMVYLHLNATKLAKAAYSDRTPPRIDLDGEGLAPVLAYMALNDPDGFDALRDEMCRLIPNLRRIRFTKVPVERLEHEYAKIGAKTVKRQATREYQGDAILFDFVSANNVSAHTASEGTLMLLGLLTVLLGPAHPDILLLDDMDYGLHPLAQKSLLESLSRLMDRFPALQIVATAHSPYLLDELTPEQIRLMTIGPDGYAVCGRLTDHPQFDKWKDEMAPGELWSLFGERWLAEEGAVK